MKTMILAAALALSATCAAAQQTPVQYGAPISSEQAQRLVAAAIAEARKANFTMAFAVVEPNGALVAFQRMDGVQYGSIRISQEKAFSAAQFRRPTKALADSLAGGNAGVTTMGVVAVEGGLLIMSGGKAIGAIGASGGTSAQDGQVAQAALVATGLNAQP